MEASKKCVLALLLALFACQPVTAAINRDAKAAQKEQRKRVTTAYNQCIKNVRNNFDPKRDDFVAMIARCREWAIMTTR